MPGLETQLVIKAVDDTGAAFASVQAKIRELNASVASINAQVGSVGRASANVTPAAASVAAQPRPAREDTKAVGAGAIETIVGVAAAVTGVAAVAGGYKEAAARQHETMRQTVQNLTAEQMAAGEKASAELAKKYPSISQSDLMHLYRTGVTIAGQEDALAALEPMAKLRVIAQAARPGASAEEQTEEMDKLLKSSEIKGVASDPGKFRSYINAVAKTLNAFGDQLKPSDIFEQLKYARQAAAQLSERFVTSTMATIGSEIGGSSIGTAAAAFNRAMVGGHMEHEAAVRLAQLGLFNEGDLITVPATGEIKGVKRGAHVKGWRLAQSDPDLWLSQVFSGALKEHGIVDPDEIAAEISADYPNKMAGALASTVLTQAQKLQKNAALRERAMGEEAADVLSKSDIYATTSGLANQIKSFIASQLPSMGAISTAASWLGSGIGYLTPSTEPSITDLPTDFEKDVEGWKAFFAKEKQATSATVTPARRYGRHTQPSHVIPAEDPGGEHLGAVLSEHISAALSSFFGGHGASAPPQDVNVRGDATVTVPVQVTVTASPLLLATIERAEKTATAQIALNPIANGHSGRMDSDASPSHHSEIGYR